MRNIKIIENNKDVAPIKDGQLADRMFYMRHIEYGDWYLEQVTSRDALPVFARPSPECANITASECIRISLVNGSIQAINANEAIERLCDTAKSYRLPTVPKEDILEVLSALAGDCACQLDNDSLFIAILQINAAQTGIVKNAVHGAEFTVSLRFVKRPDSAPALRAVSGTCPVMSGSVGALHDSAVALSDFIAQEKGFDCMLWLDSVYEKYIEGLAGMDIFVRMGDRVIAPGSFESAFGKCMADIISDWSIEVDRSRLSIDELIKNEERVDEVFAVSADRGVRVVTGIEHGGTLLDFKSGKLTKKLFDTLTNIERGIYPSVKGLITKI